MVKRKCRKRNIEKKEHSEILAYLYPAFFVIEKSERCQNLECFIHYFSKILRTLQSKQKQSENLPTQCFDNGYVAKQPVVWKEYSAEF